MRYFHRTHVSPDDVLAEADQYFGGQFQTLERDRRSRAYESTIGTVTLTVEPDGGHYTLITLGTDKVGESEVDKVSKRFLTTVHTMADRRHSARGAY